MLRSRFLPLLALLSWGCSSGSAGGTGGDGGTCSAGTEGCPCYGNDTCNAGLQCLSHLCVELGGAAGSTGGPDGGAGGTTGAAGTGTGGNTGTAGAIGTGGNTGTAGAIGTGGATGAGGAGGSILRGPTTVTLTGTANALRWDNATSTLYLTDDATNKLLKYTDANSVEPVSSFPASTAGTSLGDIVKRGDGTILTASFGFGTDGRIYSTATNGNSSTLTGIDPVRRRFALGLDSNGVIYGAYYTGNAATAMGSVTTIVLGAGGTATETEIVGPATHDALKRPTGLVATPSAVFVADAGTTTIYKIAMPSTTVTTVGAPPSVGSLAMMPNGDLLTGGTAVHRITQAGTVTSPFTGFDSVKGIAYDPTLRRLFFIDHSVAVGTPDKLQIRPLDN